MAETRSRVFNSFLLLAAGIIVVAIGEPSFFAADRYHVSVMWVFCFWMSIVFLAVIIPDFKTHLKSFAFASFLAAWLMVHITIFALFLLYFGLLYWAIIVPFELAAGYVAAKKIFNVSYPWQARRGQ